MSRDWVLEVEPDVSQGGGCVARLGLKDPQSGKVIQIASSRGPIEELRKEISILKGELDSLLEDASRKMDGLGKGTLEADPEQAWKKMQSFAADNEMIEYFNAFNESERARIAEYIFSNVSMFKGRGPVFSERYDAASHTLE